MNARSYRVKLNLSPLDFPAIKGLGESSVAYQTDVPKISNNKMVLSITKRYVLIDMLENREYEILAAHSVYEIPTNEIKSREDIHGFYNDAALSLSEAYQYAKTNLPTLPNINFTLQPIENYKPEIDWILNFLNSQN